MKQHSNNLMFDPLQHQQGVWTKPRLQRYFPIQMTTEDHNPPANEQPCSIWEDIYIKKSTSNRDTSNSEVSTLGMSICITDKINNNNSLELSTDPTKYKTLDAEDVTNDTTTPLPTTIHSDDQTTISSMTSNNYNYKKKADKVDSFTKSFLQNNNILSKHSQQKPNTKTSEDESEETQEIQSLVYM